MGIFRKATRLGGRVAKNAARQIVMPEDEKSKKGKDDKSAEPAAPQHSDAEYDELQEKYNALMTEKWKEYYKTTLLLRTTAQSLDVYLAGIGSTDRAGQYLSTAMRLGLVVQGQEFIFELNKASNHDRIGDNGSEKAEGYYVLDSTKNDGTVVPFTPLDDSALCNYDPATGAASRKENSVKICTLTGPGGQYSEPVSVDVYLWLEGCDEDCTVDLAGQTMELVSLIFAGL